ncbi:hypothetical protein H6775_00740 [Candidatus Nomurabacteria bacterium]|nr:hypothetical protein [Candidatus Nomurabacteria bacterium]
MNKVIIWIIVAVVFVGGGILVFSEDKNGADDNGKMMEEDFAGSVKDLFLSGKNVTCTFSRTDENGEMAGTVYIKASEEKVRGDFTLKQSDGNEFETHVINDNQYGYTWGTSPFGTMAIKFDVSEDNKDDTESDDQPFNPDEKLDYKCKSWNIDESKFTPPSDVEFQDFSHEMQMMQDSQASVKNSQCSACDQIPDPNSQAQCRAALGC